MSKRKSFLKGMCLVMVLLMSSNVAYAVKTSSKTVKERDLNNNKDLKKAKDYMNKGENKKDFDSGASLNLGTRKNADGSTTRSTIEKDHNGNYTIREYTTGGSSKDRDRDNKKPSEPVVPPKPASEVIIESKDNNTVVWIEREYEYDKPSNSWKPVDYKYQIDLITSANIYDADGKQQNKVTIKAGYGIKVDGSSKFEMKQIAGNKKDSTAGFKQTLPTAGTVTTDFAVKKNIAQNKTLNLESKGNGSFVTAKNSGSKTGAKVVYTDIAQKDGKYSVVVKFTNAKLSGPVLGDYEMSDSKTLNFNIKGSMYEDSYVKPTDSTKNKNNTGFEPITFDNGFN